MAQEVYDQLDFKPTGPEQSAPLQKADRFVVIPGGERSGKSFVSEKILLPHVIGLPYLRHDKFFYPNGKPRIDVKTFKPRNPDFCLFGPNYSKPRIEFEYLENDLRRMGKLVDNQLSKPRDGAWGLVTTEGVVVNTFSLENPESVSAIDLEGALVCEAGACPYAGIERIRGRVAAKRGFIVYSGTVEDSGQWWKDWIEEGKRPNTKGLVTYTIPSWANRHEFPFGKEDPEFESWRAHLGDDDLFMERCAAIPRPKRERVMKEATAAHIKELDIPDDARIEAWIDPGYATAYAILFVAIWEQKGKPFFYVYDELYEQRLNTLEMISLCRKMPFWNRVNEGVIDIASKGHRDATDSALEIWESNTDILWHKKFWYEDRLMERLQASFRAGQIAINPKCKGLLGEAGLGEPAVQGQHPWKYPVDKDGRVIGEKPIDRWNHSAKALGYGLLKHLGQVERRRQQTAYNRLRKPGSTLTPDQLWDRMRSRANG